MSTTTSNKRGVGADAAAAHFRWRSTAGTGCWHRRRTYRAILLDLPRRRGVINFNVAQVNTYVYHVSVTAQEFKRWLSAQGCAFAPGHGGHLKVLREGKRSVLPMHGKGKELGTGLVNRIKKDLGLL